MMTIDQQVRMLATAGKTPYEIEEELGLAHYTIHLSYHHALMVGYERRYSGLSSDDKDYQKDYYARNREWIAFKKKEQRAKEQANAEKQEAAASRRFPPTARAVLNQRIYRRPG